MARVVLDLPAIDPVIAFAPFADDPLAVLLDSAAKNDPRARFSYIAADPVDLLVAQADDDPFAWIKQRQARRRQPPLAHLPPFQGGIAGWLSYDLAQRLERLPASTSAQPRFPLAVLGEFDAIAAFDHHCGGAWVIGAAKAAQRLRERLLTPSSPPNDNGATSPVAADLNPADYQARVARVIKYILAGDVFQANLTQRFTARLPQGLSPFDLYRRMRARAPAPFAAFVASRDCALAAVSPERFLALSADGRAETRPIKGTRPRGHDAVEDHALARQLATSVKDRAENLMILDLMRNDFSKVCALGSISAPQRMELESFAAVHHLVSVVCGQLRPGLDGVDLLRACFPPGSITGAPKIRAMEIIAELETAPRGPYCGAYGWFGDDGAMDLAVAIRIAACKDGLAIIHAGGAITADSQPSAEWDETLVKAAPLIAALAEGSP